MSISNISKQGIHWSENDFLPAYSEKQETTSKWLQSHKVATATKARPQLHDLNNISRCTSEACQYSFEKAANRGDPKELAPTLWIDVYSDFGIWFLFLPNVPCLYPQLLNVFVEKE